MPTWNFSIDKTVQQHKRDGQGRPKYDGQGRAVMEDVTRTEGLGSFSGATRDEAILAYLRAAGWTKDDVKIEIRIAPHRRAEVDRLKIRAAE